MRALFTNYVHIMCTFIGFVLHTFGNQHRQFDIFGVYHKHVTFICAVCSQQLRRDVTVTLRTCPSWLLQRHPCGSPDVPSILVPLQWVLHVATHLLWWTWNHVITSSALRKLHWLPVTARIQCKLCLLLHNSRVSHSPQYLSQLLTPVFDIPLRLALRLARNSDFDVPRSRRKIGERAFCIVALLEYRVHSWL